MILLMALGSPLFGHINGPDPASNGIFGQAACNAAGCHVGNPLNSPTGSGLLTLSGLPANWTPGQTYPLTVTISRTGSGRYGFQLSAVSDTGNTQAGTLAVSTSNRVSVITGGGVQYAQHNAVSSALAPTGVFVFNWTAPASATVGTVRFNVAANAANGDNANTGDFIYTRVDRVSAATAPPPPPPPIQTFYYPQVANGIQADGVSWKTSVFLHNPSTTATAEGFVTFTASNGTPFQLAFVDELNQSVSTGSSGNAIQFSLAPGATRKYISTGAGALLVGFATVTSSAIINGTAIFSKFAPNGALTSEAGVPASDTVARQSIIVDTVAGFLTGVAYANPGGTAASITLQLFNRDGAAIGAATTTTLAPGTHTAAFIGQSPFPSAAPFVGTMQVTSNVPLAAIALRFNPTGEFFTTVPSVPLP